ncbi:MAG: chemotaxis protein CheA [Clostridiaceae bacterium]|jgi:two-component system chemotaxis sensor kinase CheA|nr:chemotaxis protein CheA [Clostridiaceae bacterium]
MDMNQYLEIFIEETKEHLQSLNQCLLQMEKDPEDTLMLNEIFRVAHTLKGMSGTMGFTRMARLTHDMEDVLQSLRNNEIKTSPNLIDLLFKCLDALDEYNSSIVDTGSEGTEDNLGIIEELRQFIEHRDSDLASKSQTDTPSVTPPLASDGDDAGTLVEGSADIALNQYDIDVIEKASNMGNNAYQVTIKLDKGCVLKSARAFIVFKTLERHSEIIKSEPLVQDIEDEKFDFEFTLIILSKEDEELILKDLMSISEIEDVIIKLIKASNPDGNLVVEKESESQVSEHDSKAEHADDEAIHQKADSVAKKTKTGKTVRVDIDRLDVLLNLVSELIIQKTRLEGLEGIERTPDYVETLEYLERITTNLHDAVMKVRMVPVETVFNRFPRMIRDISKDLGKEVDLRMSGEETELDRTVIDEIGDPLIHLLRNSCDHGIESKEQRKKLGKPEVGVIELKAYQDGNNVVIEVGDDGQGINTEKVKKLAIERGLLNEDMAANLTKKDIIDYLFKPSFSTADHVTDLSGRGVGLDVVKTKIEALGGSVEVETELGKGSKFFIRLPLTLAIIQALLVMVGEEKYAIQLSTIHKIINITPDDIKLVQKQEVVMYRNSVVPVIRLEQVLEVPKDDNEEQKTMTLVIVKKGERLTGFMVDRILGQQEIVQKSLGKFLSGIKIITSATILGDGNVALILDVNALAM